MAKFPFIKQKDGMQCGITCIASICQYYGKKYSVPFLSKFCDTTSTGISMLSLAECAKKIDFETMCVRLKIEEMSDIDMPCILHWNQNHYVILYKYNITANKFYICDPAKGLLILNNDEFNKHWLTGDNWGISLMLEPNEGFGKIVESSSSNKHSLKTIINYILEYKKYLFQILIGLIFGCVLQLILPFLTQLIVDIGIKTKSINIIWLIMIGQLMIVVGRTITDFIRRWLLMHISMRVNISLVSDFFIKLLKLPMSFFDSKLMGDFMLRISDHNRVQSFLTGQVLGILFSIISFCIFGIVLFVYDHFVFVVFFIGSLVYGLWIALFLRKRKIIDYELFEIESINQSRTYQFVSSIQEIKLQNCENRRRWEWEDTQADLFVTRLKSLKLQQIQEGGSIFINEIKNILITIFSATAVIYGDITLGGMLAIQYIVGQLNSPIEQFMSFIYSLQDMKISIERINEIHNMENEDSYDKLMMFTTADRSISLENVYFKYETCSTKNTLEDISFCIPSGKVTAIVGASGSGKTTLIKLILGFYNIPKGDIIIASNNIRKYNLRWWRKQCGVVMQDGCIFTESIARNIAVDDGKVDLYRLEAASKIANIWDYIQSLPMKFNTIIGKEGVGLSQGQKQRILIARAIYKNPDFIVLDEATNALDAKNERAIVENLNHFYQGKTVIIVAHRLSTVKNADQIVVLDSGKIVEIGNHDSLIAQQGAYYNLVKNQLELGN